jgi:signal transduction histidine kinase
MMLRIQDLLDFSQIRNGTFRKNMAMFNVQEAVNDVMSIQHHKAE